VGNENRQDEGYWPAYRAVVTAVRKHFPLVTPIAVCNRTDANMTNATTELDMYDMHTYTGLGMNTKWGYMISKAASAYFASLSRGARSPKVFLSEFAAGVTQGDSPEQCSKNGTGIGEAGLGNMQAAVHEAAFLIDVEINSDVVVMASSAPLLMNVHDHNDALNVSMCPYIWSPTLLAFNGSRVVRTPSYWMQQMFAANVGDIALLVASQRDLPIAASASLTWSGNNIILKYSNYGNTSLQLRVELPRFLKNPMWASLTSLSSDTPRAENTFTHPENIVPFSQELAVRNHSMDIDLKPMSLGVVRVNNDAHDPRLEPELFL